MPVIAFCTNGGPLIGLGHLRRCMTLAGVLQSHGVVVRFAVNRAPGVLEVLRQAGFEGVSVGKEGDLDLAEVLQHIEAWGPQALVIDSYTVQGQLLARPGMPVLAVIDDLADQTWPVDLVINGAANAHELVYRTSPHTRLLLGTQYALLREEFAQEPNRLIRKAVQRVLIAVGGMDRFGLTLRLMEWTREALGEVALDVVVGPFFSEDDTHQLERATKAEGRVVVHRDPPKIRDLMLSCDVAIAGGGQTTYELAATGTPSLAIRIFDNQTGNVTALSAKNTLMWVGDAQDKDLHEKVLRALVQLSDEPGRRETMSRSGRLLVDGGGAQRVARAFLDICNR
jgi:UDP-2,4-diacetamido-2,4,6-trideoxy-beta-L-altropyranose hydrolase